MDQWDIDERRARGERIPGKRLDYDGLVAAGIVQWPRSTFDKIKRADPAFPRGIRDGKRMFYDADQVQEYVERYWENKEHAEHLAWMRERGLTDV